MGIDYRAAVMVGLRRRDLTMDADQLVELIDKDASWRAVRCVPQADGAGGEAVAEYLWVLT